MDMPTEYFVKKDECVTREISGETIIVPVQSRADDLDSIYTLNEWGTTIWRLIDGQTSVSRLIEAACEEYEVTFDEAQKDILDFLTNLEAAGLIQPRGMGRFP